AAVTGSLAAAQADTGSTGSTGSTGTTGAVAVPATVTVNGAGLETVASQASASTFQSAYMSALSAAMSDAHTKAVALASQAGDTLGAVQTITEQSNDGNGCSGPMFYAAGGARSAPGAPMPRKPHKTGKPKPAITHAIARIADAPSTCGVQAD